MKADRLIALTLSILLVFAQACSTYQARREAVQFEIEGRERVIAWYQAQTRLVNMCRWPERRSDCAKRYMKESPWTDEVDDWIWVMMPSYSTIVDVHEEEIRKRTPAPPLYIEYTIGAARYLAARTDRGDLPPEGFKEAFSKVWAWMAALMDQHEEVLTRNIAQAEARSNQAWQTVRNIAAGLGVVLGTALVVAAAASAAAASRPAPEIVTVTPAPIHRTIFCQAQRTGGNMVSIYCY